MNKIFKTIIVFLLAASALLVISLCMPNNDGVSNLPTDTVPEDSEPADTSEVPADTPSSGSNAALQLEDENLYIVYIVHDTEARAKIGFVADGLKPYTKYRMDWNINDSVFVDTTARFSTITTDGTVYNCIYLDTSYEPNSGLGVAAYSDVPSLLLNGEGGAGWEFTTEGEDATLVVFFFESDYVSAEQMKTLTDTLKIYVTELSFTEISEQEEA